MTCEGAGAVRLLQWGLRKMERSGRLSRWVAGAVTCTLVVAALACGSAPEGDGRAEVLHDGAAASGRRVALVVGNNAYSPQPVLGNAVNDARAVAEALGDVGFDVEFEDDVNRAEFTAALAAFAGSLQPDDVALFYFAGHGVQVDGVNYLMPVDYAGRTEEAVALDAISAVNVEQMLRPARVAMLVLDACRNNPYRGVRGGPGLAPMEARGTLVAYAAGANQLAADEFAPGSANGLFTTKFLEALAVPGLTASDLFRRVRREVHAASDEEQWPAVYDDLLADFVFRRAADEGGAEGGGAPDSPSPEAAESGGGAASPGVDAAASERLRQETVFWESIRESTDAADLEDYLRQFPDGTFARMARRRMDALADVADVVPPPDVAQLDVAQLDVAQLRQIAEQGDARAQTELGERYEDGRDGVQQDYGMAVSWFHRAADQGFAAGQAALGFMYSTGRGVAQDDGEAVTWYRRAAEQGDARGQNNLGAMYDTGRGVAQDDGEAVTWFRRAAEQGRAIGQNNLGFMYENGRGVAQDYGEAVTWYRRAAEQGDAAGQAALGAMYDNGRGVAQDDGEAVTWYRRAAEQGYAIGQAALGFMYENGRGVAQDYGEAVWWYRRAAEQGYAAGQAALGFMYENGRGVAQDYGEAVWWYRRAAEQGDAVGQAALGFMYDNGRGVAQDYGEAVWWYRRAAEQGDAIGQYNLGLMYENGSGVRQDRQEAARWFRLAAAQGNADAQRKLDRLR